MDKISLLNQIFDYISYNAIERNDIKFKLHCLVKYRYDNNFEKFINEEVKNPDYGTLIYDIKELFNEPIDFIPLYESLKNLFQPDNEPTNSHFDNL